MLVVVRVRVIVRVVVRVRVPFAVAMVVRVFVRMRVQAGEVPGVRACVLVAEPNAPQYRDYL